MSGTATNITDLAARFRVPVEAAQDIYNQGHLDGRAAPRISGLQPRAQEIPMVRALYHEAAKERISLSALLERMDPSDRYDDWVADPKEPTGRRRMDAFERQLAVADIRTKPDLKHGIPAHLVERFYQSSSPASAVLFPEYINRTIRATQLEPSILDELVAIRTLVDSDRAVSFRLTDDVTQRRMQRMPEGSSVRRVRLTGGDETIRLLKAGIEIEMTYEVVRRMPINLFALHLGLVAQQNDVDKATLAISTAVAGDGNAGTAATEYNVSDLLGTAGQPIPLIAFLAWAQKFRAPYALTTVFSQETPNLRLLTMTIGSANIPFAMFQQGQGGVGTIEPGRPVTGNVRMFVSDDAPANKYVGLDRRYALEMFSETGADLTETDKIIDRQIDLIVITDTVGFGVLDPKATKVLDMAE